MDHLYFILMYIILQFIIFTSQLRPCLNNFVMVQDGCLAQNAETISNE